MYVLVPPAKTRARGACAGGCKYGILAPHFHTLAAITHGP
jgi:hypothetical protein